MLTMIAGVPGSGKSYLLAYKAQKAMKRRPVFTSHPMKGCYKLDKKYFQRGVFPTGSLLIVDEANVWFNSRRWKERDDEILTYFAQHRHDGVDVLLGTQNPARVEVVLRENCNWFVWLQSWGFPPILKKVDGENEEGEAIKRWVAYKRAMIMRLEYVPSYEDWGKPASERSEIEGYKSEWHLVRPWVFKTFNSWDMSQLAGRDEVDRERWPERLWKPESKPKMLPGGKRVWSYPDLEVAD